MVISLTAQERYFAGWESVTGDSVLVSPLIRSYSINYETSVAGEITDYHYHEAMQVAWALSVDWIEKTYCKPPG